MTEVNYEEMKEACLEFQKLLQNYKIKQKNSVIVDNQKIRAQIFRSDDYLKLYEDKDFLQKQEQIFKKFNLPKEYSTPLGIFRVLQKCKLVLKLDRYKDLIDNKKYKWPKKVQISKTQIDEQDKITFLAFSVLPKKRRILPILIVFMVLLICLFPVWPYQVRVIVFYLSLYATIFIMIFSLIRFIIYYVLRLFGFEFWILPEIFDNDSFVPYYSFKKLQDSSLAIFLRILFLIMTVIYIGMLYMFPESHEGIGDIIVTSYDDVVDWGKEYIAFNFTKDISNKTLTYENLMDSDEAEVEKIFKEEKNNQKLDQ